MIKCICIDDKNRPKEIPLEKWVKEREEYRISHVHKMVNMGNILAYSLYEKPLDESCDPYNAFRASRFVVRPEDFPKLLELAYLCNDLNQYSKEEIQRMFEETVEVL